MAQWDQVLEVRRRGRMASNWNPALKAFHDRLAATGKKPKVVIVAVIPVAQSGRSASASSSISRMFRRSLLNFSSNHGW